MKPCLPNAVFRRFTFTVVLLILMSLTGLCQLAFRWTGSSGAPPLMRLYVHGDFPQGQALAWLRLEPQTAGSETPTCYRVTIATELEHAAPRTAQPAVGQASGASPSAAPYLDPFLVCEGQRRVFWAGDARLEIRLSTGGVPSAALVGFRPRTGDWLGSLADPRSPERSPRFPLRDYGVPGLAARLIECPGTGGSGAAGGSGGRLCLRIEDRLARTAVTRAGGGAETGLRFGDLVELRPHDRLWLGLLELEVQSAAGAAPAGVGLYFEREARLRPGGRRTAVAGGGDRRWLGRPGHIEVPDPAPRPDPLPRYELYPMRDRYQSGHLSRQRTSFEGEDVVQRLIDGQWLCLDEASGGSPQVAWRPLHQPGCGTGSSRVRAQRASAVEIYQRARYGDIGFLARNLIDTTNQAFEQRLYLRDPTALPLAFQWGLQHDPTRGELSPQPWPLALWGVRFGTTRQQRQTDNEGRLPLPEIVPRASTARHLLQVWRGDQLEASFFLPLTAAEGSLCLGSPTGAGWQEYSARAGRHLPLGAVAFSRGPDRGSWAGAAAAGCGGCRLKLTPVGVEPDSASCSELALSDTGRYAWRGFDIRYVRRGPPWLTVTDPGNGRRLFAQEMYSEAGMAPLLGDVAGLSGVEAALRQHRDRGDAPASRHELTVDGDLQLSALSVIDYHARSLIPATGGDDDRKVKISAVILDAESGAVLSAVNWSRAGSDYLARDERLEPTAWELGSAQVTGAENAAFLRRGAVGSTMKIVSAYALLNNDLQPGPDTTRDSGGVAEVSGTSGGRIGEMGLARVEGGPDSPAERGCTGIHVLPSLDSHFNQSTFIRRFAESCNNFFVLSGLRHAGSRPLSLDRFQPIRGNVPPADRLSIEAELGDLVLRHPSFDELALADRIREGLAEDAASELPRSWFGVLYRLGVQPQPGLELEEKVASSFHFEHQGALVSLPPAASWFAAGAGTAPELEPGDQFNYPAIPSPGRFDETTIQGPPVKEVFGGQHLEVRRLAEDGDWADVQYSMLIIGQSSLELSALGLATLYAPAARRDGRAMQPCLFTDNCDASGAGERVFDTRTAPILRQALQAVLGPGGTAAGSLENGRRLLDAGWGGKTGTFEVDVPVRAYGGMKGRQWRQLKAYLCGVEGVAPVRYDNASFPRLGRLAAAGRGRGLGAGACEDDSWPLNPGGVQRYNSDDLPSVLDEVADCFAANTSRKSFKSFVMVAPPTAAANVQGLVVAVIADHPVTDRASRAIAIRIGSDLAAAAQRWAEVAGR